MGSISAPYETHDQLGLALGKAHQRYTNIHPKSRQCHEEACKFLPGGNTRTVLHTTPFPLAIGSAESCHLKTVDGVVYLDFLNEYTAGIYGHSHPAIKQAIKEALDRGWNYGAHHSLEQQLAHHVCERFPSIEMVRFVNSGTEANMMAIATALAFTGKSKVLLFSKGYHGSTITGSVVKNRPSINLPHDFVVGSFNDVRGTKELVASLPRGSLAAILIEPMLGSGGCFKASTDFLKFLRETADEHQALLIFDEVMTSRLGYNGLGAQSGIQADLMTLGKYLGGGMSFGAFGGRADIMSLYDPRTGKLDHPGTFNNNVFSMAAGIAGSLLLTSNRLQELNSLGDSMRTAIEDIIQSFGITGRLPDRPVDEAMHEKQHPQRPPKMFVKGVGSLLCIHFAGPDHDSLTGLFFHHMLESGIYVAARGFISLSIELTQQHVDMFLDAINKFCQRHEADLLW